MAVVSLLLKAWFCVEVDVTEFSEADITHSDVITQKTSLEYVDEESRVFDDESRFLMLLEVILAWLFFFRL